MASAPPKHASAPQLDRLLRQATRRHAWFKVVHGATWGLAASFVGLFALLVVERTLAPNWSYGPLAGVILAFGPMAGAGVALLLGRTGKLAAALEIERHYRLQERFSSILYLSDNPTAAAEAALVQDGEEHARSVQLRQAIPFRRPRGLVPALSLLVLGAVAYFFLPNFDLWGYEEQRERQEEQSKRIEERKKRLEKRLQKLKDVAKKERVSPNTRKLLEQLEQRKKDPKGSRDPKQEKKETLADLRRMQDQVQDRKKEIEGKLSKLEKFTAELRQSAEAPRTQDGQKIEKALQAGDLSQAAQELKKMAEKLQADASGEAKLDPKKAEALKKDLDRLMKKFEREGISKKDLSKALEELDKLDPKSMSKLAEMAESMSSELSQLERLMRERDVLDQALDEIEFTEEELASLPREWPEDAEP